MRTEGTLAKWNDGRGFGFIAPKGGGQDIFVHISAFPRDGQRPKPGESLSFDIQDDKSGKIRAINVSRPGAVNVIRQRRSHTNNPRQNRSPVGRFIILLVIISIGVYGYFGNWGGFKDQPSAALRLFQGDNQISEQLQTANYICDGRTHCSQMTSCDEAKFFLRNCPNVKMDGNHDGVPCEQQWCTGFFGN